MDVRNITPSMKQQLMKMAGISDAKVIKTKRDKKFFFKPQTYLKKKNNDYAVFFHIIIVCIFV